MKKVGEASSAVIIVCLVKSQFSTNQVFFLLIGRLQEYCPLFLSSSGRSCINQIVWNLAKILVLAP